MSSDYGSVLSPPMFDFVSVMRVVFEQIKEDRLRLASMDGVEAGRIRQQWSDLNLIQFGIRRSGDGWKRALAGPLPSRLAQRVKQRMVPVRRLARTWAADWKFHDPRLWDAAVTVAAQGGVRVREIKEQLLQRTIFLALHDSREPQITKIGRDRAMRLGSELVLAQVKDLEEPEKLMEKWENPPAGVHAFPPYRLLSPIEAVYAGHDPNIVCPSDLRPSYFGHWAFRRAVKHAETYLLREAGFDPDKPHGDWRRVEVIEPASDDADVKSGGNGQVREIDLLDVLDGGQTHPLRQILAKERLAEVLDAATGTERETIELLQLFHVNVGLPKADAIKKIAEVRDVSVNSVHQTLSRIRRNHGN